MAKGDREELLTAALRLPTADRAAIAGALIRSLDEEEEDQAAVEEAWAEEIRRRIQELDAGTVETFSKDEALRFIRDGSRKR
jgi:putative addiction module component (TIGR02574 family)